MHWCVLQLVLLLCVEDETLALDKRLQWAHPHGRRKEPNDALEKREGKRGKEERGGKGMG
jgi:hypothetical protein